MSINFIRCSTNVRYTYNNLEDALHDFQDNTTKENKEEVLNRINEMQRELSVLKSTMKNIYLGGTNETIKRRL